MFTRREWSDEARQVIADQLNQIEHDIGFAIGTPKRSQREAMLGVTKSKLDMAQSPEERAEILSKARHYITGGFSFGLKGSQRRQLGALGGMALAGGPGEGESTSPSNQATSYPQVSDDEGMEKGGIIPGKRDDSVGDDLVAIDSETGKKTGFKKGEYVIPTEIVDYVGEEKLDKFVEKARKNLGLKRKAKSTGYQDGGKITDEKDIRAFVETGQEGAPVQAVEKTPAGDYAGAVISPEAANKLYKAWGLDKESPNWQPEYGVPVYSNTYHGGARTAQVIQPGPGGVMPGVELTSGRKIPMGLSRPAFEERAGEEDVISRLPNAKEQAAYLEGKEKTGLERRKVAAEEELVPFKKAELQARTLKHGRAPEKKEGTKPPWNVEKEFDMLSNQVKGIDAEIAALAKNPLGKGYAQQRSVLIKEREKLQGRMNEIIGKGPATPEPTPTKPAGPSYGEFVKAVRAKGSKLPDAQLKAYYDSKYGGRK